MLWGDLCGLHWWLVVQLLSWGVSVWVALSEYELRLRRSLAGAMAWLVWMSLMASLVGDVWLRLVNVAGEWSVKVDWVNGDSVSGDVLSVVMEAVDWRE